jgi:hypothetical protein
VNGNGDHNQAPPVGEEIHLPGPSVVPLLNAAGLAIAIIGLTIGTGLIIAGLLLFLVTLVRWIRDTSRDIEALPAEHRSH